MKCKFLTRDGKCTGAYAGYACIKKQCSSLKLAQSCEHHELSGDYCKKYGRFGCVGRESCRSLADYLEAVADSEHAS